MQPILLLAIAGVAIAATSVGFLSNEINMSGMVQQFGVGEETIDTPVSNAYIDFVIDRTSFASNGKTKYKNIVSDCVVQVDKRLATDSTIFCKLTDEFGQVIAEGKKKLTSPLQTEVPTNVEVTQLAYMMSNDVKNVHDVLLVVQGPSALAPIPQP